jgi:hypothetical protein
MLMGNASKILQTVAANIDRDVYQPLLEQLFDMPLNAGNTALTVFLGMLVVGIIIGSLVAVSRAPISAAHQPLAAAQWPALRACRHPAGRDRGHFREPAQCDGGCRRALPQGGQCDHLAGGVRQLAHIG